MTGELSARDITVWFGGVQAVDNVSLSLSPGEVVGLIGPNGSGKSTCFNAIAGFVDCRSGHIECDGVDVSRLSAASRVRAGLVRTFQTPRIDPEITVASSVMCGFHTKLGQNLMAGAARTPSMRREEQRIADECRALLSEFKIDHLADAPLGALPMGQIRLVDVARAIATGPKYLLLDEPAAGLSRADQDVFQRVIENQAAKGIGILIVEHNFQLVRRMCSRIALLDRGKIKAWGRPDEMRHHAEFVKLYLGQTYA